MRSRRSYRFRGGNGGVEAAVALLSAMAFGWEVRSAGYDDYATAEVVATDSASGAYQPEREDGVPATPVYPGMQGCCQPEGVFCGPAEGGSRSGGIVNGILGPACPRWTAQVDALMLWRSNVASYPLLALNNGTTFPTVLNANEIYSDMAVGPRAALMLHLDNEYAFEGNYFYVGSISGSSAFVAPAATGYAFDNLAGWNLGDITNGVAVLNGEIQSVELNVRHRHCGSPVTWLAGFRWVEWNDELTINDNFAETVEPFAVGTDNVRSLATNDLYGGQLGLDALLLTFADVMRINAVAKAGVYGNFDAQNTVSVGGDRIGPDTITRSRDQVSFFGEIGVNGAVRISQHVFWRAGYNFFWLAGVATAPQQLGAVDLAGTSQGRVDAGGSVFLQGVNTGIEVLW